MTSYEKGKFPYSFFILLIQWHEFPALKMTNFLIFIIPLPLNVTLSSRSPYFTAHIKINYDTGCTGRFSGKKHKDVSRIIATAKMNLFMALVSSFQLLTNFTKISNIGAMGVLNAPLEYYNVFWNLSRWSN